MAAGNGATAQDGLVLDHWVEMGRRLTASPGVHQPSTFSALLAATMHDVRGQVVVDAGCGAGLVTVAALYAGAEHVIAQDYDPACLADTSANVEQLLGREARRRLTLWEADWRQLGPMCADLLAVNPPQRPLQLLPDVDPAVLHLHDGGGDDGLDALRLVLAHARTGRVRSTAAAALKLPDASPALATGPWRAPRLIVSRTLPFDPAWRRFLPDLRGQVDVWEFTRA
jgi:methylase of polypeptide subunit release factors